jgi:SPP1 family predicted phage head-tail adaptor
MKAPSLGAMRHRLTIESPNDRADGFGGLIRSFVARATIFAAMEHVKMVQRSEAFGERVEITHLIHLRGSVDVAAGWRLRKGARCFEIIAVLPDDQASGFILCHCRELEP